MTAPPPGRLPAAFCAVGTSSFVDFLGAHDPHLLPARSGAAAPARPDARPGDGAPHATTIVAMTTAAGVLMAGDRRATAGSMIAHRDMEKVYPADSHSCVGIAGTAGIAVEMVRLFQVELEHYEKIEGAPLSLEGKANRLSTMVRANLGAAMQGLAAVPLLAGHDLGAAARGEAAGRIYSYDVTGGRYAEADHHAIGSGSVFARGSLKKRWRPDLDEADAVAVAVEALLDAADDDSATGGPDTVRGIYPLVVVVDADGYRRVGQGELAAATAALLDARRGAAGGDRRRGATQAEGVLAPDGAAQGGEET